MATPEELKTIVDEVDVEVLQLNEADARLAEANLALVAAQEAVAAQQAIVNAAVDTVAQEKADVISKLEAIVAKCNEYLTQLQSE